MDRVHCLFPTGHTDRILILLSHNHHHILRLNCGNGLPLQALLARSENTVSTRQSAGRGFIHGVPGRNTIEPEEVPNPVLPA